jgi:hypothetical protein
VQVALQSFSFGLEVNRGIHFVVNTLIQGVFFPPASCSSRKKVRDHLLIFHIHCKPINQILPYALSKIIIMASVEANDLILISLLHLTIYRDLHLIFLVGSHHFLWIKSAYPRGKWQPTLIYSKIKTCIILTVYCEIHRSLCFWYEHAIFSPLCGDALTKTLGLSIILIQPNIIDLLYKPWSTMV